MRLGPLELRPPTREVRDPCGALHVLEPRVMQVLVALAQAQGAVVSRHVLVKRCWGGRTIGDDAINRSIGKARQVAELSTPPAFVIEAIPRVGYRLLVAGAPSGPREPPGRSIPQSKPTASIGPPRARKLKPWVGLTLVAALFAGGLALLFSHRDVSRQSSEVPGVVIAPIEISSGDRYLALLARDIRADIIAALGDGRLPNGQALDVQVVLTREDEAAQAHVVLRDQGSSQVLWSYAARQAWLQRSLLRQELAATLVDAVQAAREPSLQPGLTVDPLTESLFIRSVLTLQHPAVTHEEGAAPLLAEAIRRNPTFASAHANNAIALMDGCEPATAEGRRGCDAVRAEAERAIKLSPLSSGAAFDALFQLAQRERPADLAEAEAILQRGLASAPSFPFLPMRTCIFLASVGRADDALLYCRRALALRPLGTPVNLRLAQALWAADEVDLSARVYAAASRRAPDYEPMRRGLTDIAVFSRPVVEAARVLEDPDLRSPTLAEDTLNGLRSVLRARASGRKEDVAKAVSDIANAGEERSEAARYRVMTAGLFARPDDAFASEAGDPAPAAEAGGFMTAPVWFLPVTESLRHDQRFWRLMADRGLVRYWQGSGWPDFCGKQDFSLICRQRLGLRPAVQSR